MSTQEIIKKINEGKLSDSKDLILEKLEKIKEEKLEKIKLDILLGQGYILEKKDDDIEDNDDEDDNKEDKDDDKESKDDEDE